MTGSEIGEVKFTTLFVVSPVASISLLIRVCEEGEGFLPQQLMASNDLYTNFFCSSTTMPFKAHNT